MKIPTVAKVQTSALPPSRGDLAAFRKLAPAQQLASIRGTRVERVFQIDRANGIDEGARTVWLSIASEQPYERWWGVEILEITPAAIRDERLKSGMAVLVGHDTSDHVGVVERYEIAPDRRLRILVRFGRSARAEEIWQDVLDGIRRHTSVGYIIHELVLEKQDENVATYRVTDWEPLEGSLVAVPADHTVGVGRSAEAIHHERNRIMENEQLNAEHEHQGNLSRSQRRREANEEASEDRRIAGLFRAGQEFKNMGGDKIAQEIIDSGGSMETFSARMLESMRGRHRPTNTAEPFYAPYGDGARTMPRHGKLRCFTGDGGPERAYAFGQWLRAQLPGREEAVRWCRENGVVHNRYLTGTTDPSGGYLVPDDLAAEVIKNMDEHGEFRKQARVWPMSTDSLSIPKRTGGLTASFVQENTESTPGDPSFGSTLLVAKEVMCVTNMTLAVVEDSPIDLADYVGMEIAEAFSLKEDQCGFIGDGTSTFGGMTGLNPKLLIATASQHTAAANHDTAPEIDATDLANLMAKLPQYAHKGAKWYMSMAFYGAIILRLMMAAGGNTIRTLEAGSSANPTFAGYEVVLSPVLPSDVTEDLSGDVMMLFGNLRRSTAFGDRRVISLLLDPYTLAGKSQIRIIGRERFDIVNHDVGDTSTAGPVVALVGAA